MPVVGQGVPFGDIVDGKKDISPNQRTGLLDVINIFQFQQCPSIPFLDGILYEEWDWDTIQFQKQPRCVSTENCNLAKAFWSFGFTTLLPFLSTA